MTDKDTSNFSLEIDLNNQRIIGASDAKTEEAQEIARKITKSISNSLKNLSSAWIEVFNNQIANNEFQEAYELFEQHKDTLQLNANTETLEKLRQMDVSKLDKDSRREYLIYIVALSSYLGERQHSQPYIENLLNEYLDQLEPILVQNLVLEKANIASESEHFSKASLLYKQVISSDDSDSGTVAWAYQGLSKNAENNTDKLTYAERAADKHLEAGNKIEAVKNIIKISDIKSNENPKDAIELIDKCIALFGSENLIQKELLASLKHKKSSYLHTLGNNRDAHLFVMEACNLRRGLIGNEIELHASLALASKISKAIGSIEESNQLEDEALKLSEKIEDEDFLLRSEVCNLISQSEVIEGDLITKIISSGDKTLLSGALLYQAINNKLSIEESIGLLDRARIEIESQEDKRMLDVIYYCIAEMYRTEKMIDDAYINYRKSLSINQFYHLSAQNCASMLFEEERWVDAENFTRERLELVGELPGVCFAYAKALFKNGNYKLAFKYFKLSDPKINGLDEYIFECLNNLQDTEITSIEDSSSALEYSITADQFYKVLEEFSTSISSDSRMHFWYKDKDSGKYKWTKNPEELSKQMLITFLNGKFGKGKVEIIQEHRAGAGFIDLYALLPGGLKVVIELKMCGNGYSSTYALSGESQIIHYQLNRATNIGYLVVFDSRARDYGKHFKNLQVIDNHTIYTTSVDMRPEIVKK